MRKVLRLAQSQEEELKNKLINNQKIDMMRVDVYSKEFWVKTFIGYLAFSTPFMILSIILNLMGELPIDINGEPRYGVGASLLFLIYFPLMSFLFSILNWVIVMSGYWLYIKLKKLLPS